jgi:hypothetical protein
MICELSDRSDQLQWCVFADCPHDLLLSRPLTGSTGTRMLSSPM